jgi:triosephosphate isomerase
MKKLVVGNWKQNNINIDYKEYVEKLESITDKEVVIAPPYVYLPLLNCNNVKLAGQDVSIFNGGSNTGEISCDMLKEFKCEYVIIGHNERRTKLGESNEYINKKVLNALENGLKVILCITCIEELTLSIKDVTNFDNLLIAFEPKEFIGKSETISREGLIDFISKINEVTNKKFRVLYGGGIKADNISNLSNIDGLDGLLVGKASLDINAFLNIIINW